MFKNILATVVLFALGTAFAQPPGQQRRVFEKEMVRGPGALIERLNLTDVQETQMQKLRIGLMKKQTQLRSRVQTLRLDSKELFLADKVDRKTLENNVKAISEVQEQMKLNMVEHFFAVNTILNPHQQKIWKQHAMQMGERIGAGIRHRMGEQMRMRHDDDMGGPNQDF